MIKNKRESRLLIRNSKIKRQMYILFFLVLVLLISAIGSYLIENTKDMLNHY